MALSTQRAVSDGTMSSIALSLSYFNRAEITVYFNNVVSAPGSGLWAWVGTTGNVIAFTPNVPNGVEVLLKRSTSIDSTRHIYNLGAQFNESTVDENFAQVLRAVQEATEGGVIADVFNDLDMHGYRVKNVAPATTGTDAVNADYVASAIAGIPTVPILDALAVKKTADLNNALIPVRTTGNRGSVTTAGQLGYNSTTTLWEGYSGSAWVSLQPFDVTILKSADLNVTVQAYNVNTAFKNLTQNWVGGAQRQAPVALTDAATIAVDANLGNNFSVTLAGNRTLGAPTNIGSTQSGSIFITQDATGSRTLAFNSVWKFEGGTAPSLSTTPNAEDRLDYIVKGTTLQSVLSKDIK